MRIQQSVREREDSGVIPSWLSDIAMRVFQISLLTTVGLYAYLLWGIFSGSLADATQPHAGANAAQVLQAVNTVSLWLTISVVVTVVSSLINYYDEDTYGFILVGIAVFMAVGLQFLIDTLFVSEAARLTSGKASVAALQTIHQTALVFGIPGVLLVLRSIVLKLVEGRRGQDLTKMTYGGGVKREERKQPLIGAAAKCWELPFCREGIRVRCPIFHAKTKCWKERVGCMCEENIILLAMEGASDRPPAGTDMTKEQGFVPLGDLLTKPTTETKTHIPTRVGPRGVRLPTNPHLTDAQKRDRCRNCIIYNEHQRQKYQLFSPVVTLIVPVLVYLKFEDLRVMLNSGLMSLDSLVSKVSLTGGKSEAAEKLAREVSSSLTVEVIIIGCLTLVAMTWAIRFLEYCMFKIKI